MLIGSHSNSTSIENIYGVCNKHYISYNIFIKLQLTQYYNIDIGTNCLNTLQTRNN